MANNKWTPDPIKFKRIYILANTFKGIYERNPIKSTITQIAEQFGFSERTVRMYLKLAEVEFPRVHGKDGKFIAKN